MNDPIDRLEIEPMEPRTMTRQDQNSQESQKMAKLMARSRPWLLAGAMVSCLSIAAVVSSQAGIAPSQAAPKSPAEQLRAKIALAAAEGRSDSNGLPPTSNNPTQAMPASVDTLPDLTTPSLEAMPRPPVTSSTAVTTTSGLDAAGSTRETAAPDVGSTVSAPAIEVPAAQVEMTPPPVTATVPAPAGDLAVTTTSGLAPAGSPRDTDAPDVGTVVAAPAAATPAEAAPVAAAPVVDTPVVETHPVEIPAGMLPTEEPMAVTTTRGLDSANSPAETSSPDAGRVTTGTADAPAPARPSEMAADDSRVYFAPQDEKSDVMLQGEYAERTYEFSVPASQSTNGAKLVLTYDNSIQDLPELSSLEVRLNDKPIASLPLNAYNSSNKVEIDLPAQIAPAGSLQSFLRAGKNTLTFVARQRHRVTCSLDGTFELWTKIAAAQTYIQFAANPNPTPVTLASVEDLFGAAAGDKPMTIYTYRSMSTDHETWGADIAQGYALRVGERRAVVQHQVLPLKPGATSANGLVGIDFDKLSGPTSILIGSRRELAPVISPSLASNINGPYIGIIPLGAGHGNMLLISGDTDENVGKAAENFKIPDQQKRNYASYVLKSDDTLRAIPDDRVIVQPEKTYTLKQLGYTDQPTSASRQVFTVPVRMPPDLYIADDSQVTVSVNGLYRGDLAADAILNIFVNGRVAAGVRLDQPLGEEIRNRVVTLQMRDFKPGLNLVEFEAKLPKAGVTNGACLDPVTPANPVDARFTLFDTTALKFPAYPRLGSLPDLHTTATTAFPYYYLGYYTNNDKLNLSEQYNFYVPSNDSQTVSAAWTVIAKLAQTARQPLKMVAISGSDMNSTSGNVLIVGPLDELDSTSFLRTAPVRSTDMHQAWRSVRLIDPLVTSKTDIAANEATEEMLSKLNSLKRASEAPANINPVVVPDDELALYNEELRQRQRVKLAEENSSTTITKQDGVLVSARKAIVEFFRGRELDPHQTTQLLDPGTDMPTAVIMQYESPYKPSSTWTVLTAPDSGMLWASARRLVTPSYWNRLAGEVTAFGPNPGALRWRAPTKTYYVQTRDWNMSNAQLIIGNWFSKNIIYWTFIIMGMLVLLGMITHLLVSRFGQSAIPGENQNS